MANTVGSIGFGPAFAGMTDEQIRAAHARTLGSTVGGAHGGAPVKPYCDKSAELRERVIQMLTRDGMINTAELLQTADRIVKYIQTGDKDAK